MLVSVLLFVSGVGGGIGTGAWADSTSPLLGAGEDRQPTVAVTDAAVDVGNTATVEIQLSRAPDGLSGYKLNLTVVDADVAAITDASYSEVFELTEDPAINAPNTTVQLKATDLEDPPGPNATDVSLASVTLKGQTPGTTTLTVDIKQMDDDSGGRVQPATESGTLTVRGATPISTSTPAPTASPTQTPRSTRIPTQTPTPGSSPTETVTPVPSPTTGGSPTPSDSPASRSPSPAAPSPATETPTLLSTPTPASTPTQTSVDAGATEAPGQQGLGIVTGLLTFVVIFFLGVRRRA